MAKLTRTAAIELMQACGFTTIAALSTHRLEKKVNRLDRVTLDWKKLTSEQKDQLDFVLEAINNDVRVEVSEDRPEIPRPEREDKRLPRTEGRKSVQRFDQHPQKYDWPSIFSGGIVELVKGTDYSCKTQAMAMQIRNAAKRRDLVVKIATRQDKVIVQAVKS